MIEPFLVTDNPKYPALSFSRFLAHTDLRTGRCPLPSRSWKAPHSFLGCGWRKSDGELMGNGLREAGLKDGIRTNRRIRHSKEMPRMISGLCLRFVSGPSCSYWRPTHDLGFGSEPIFKLVTVFATSFLVEPVGAATNLFRVCFCLRLT